MNLDQLDRKIVYLLDLNSREKELVIASKTKTSKQIVAYRLKRLVENGVIRQFQGVLNLETFEKTIYASVYIRVSGDVDSVVTFLQSQPNVGYVAKLGGSYDISIILVGKSLEDVDEQIQGLMNQKPNLLGSFISQFRIRAYKFPKNYLVSKTFQTHVPKNIFRKNTSFPQVDSLDKNILRIISRNSRVKTIEIARKLKIAFSTIRQRIQVLLEKGLLEGFTTLLDLDKIGMLNYKILIQTKSISKTDFQRLYQFAHQHPDITWFFKTFGPFQFEMRIEVENQKEFQKVIQKLRSEFSEIIEHIESVLVFEEVKEDYSIVLV